MADWNKVKAFVEKIGERKLTSGQTAYDAHVVYEDGSEADVSFFEQPQVKEFAGKELEFLMQTKGKYVNGKLIEAGGSAGSKKGGYKKSQASDKELLLRCRTMGMSYAKDLIDTILTHKKAEFDEMSPEKVAMWARQWTLDTSAAFTEKLTEGVPFNLTEGSDASN